MTAVRNPGVRRGIGSVELLGTAAVVTVVVLACSLGGTWYQQPAAGDMEGRPSILERYEIVLRPGESPEDVARRLVERGPQGVEVANVNRAEARIALAVWHSEDTRPAHIVSLLQSDDAVRRAEHLPWESVASDDRPGPHSPAEDDSPAGPFEKSRLDRR